MTTHQAAAWGEPGEVSVIDDAGRGELYVSTFLDGNEISAPRLVSASESLPGRIVDLRQLVHRDNLALRTARRALEIERAGNGDRHRDLTPVYVRLAEAEVKLKDRLKS
jgi:hypothetical protein